MTFTPAKMNSKSFVTDGEMVTPSLELTTTSPVDTITMTSSSTLAPQTSTTLTTHANSAGEVDNLYVPPYDKTTSAPSSTQRPSPPTTTANPFVNTSDTTTLFVRETSENTPFLSTSTQTSTITKANEDEMGNPIVTMQTKNTTPSPTQTGSSTKTSDSSNKEINFTTQGNDENDIVLNTQFTWLCMNTPKKWLKVICYFNMDF